MWQYLFSCYVLQSGSAYKADYGPQALHAELTEQLTVDESNIYIQDI